MFSQDVKAQPEYAAMVKNFDRCFDLAKQGVAAKKREQDHTPYQLTIHRLNLAGLQSIKPFLTRDSLQRCKGSIRYLEQQIKLLTK